ncbi:hypothetical protein WR25_14522 [Diploscapter pachys]|uniref:Palmitoyltransferase n=1 Tax=Diploscapter pachys TaxID=2018661 RepID=A0A2A2JU26_9BILA|nr:hypothetical protein WR25_14522 [Diploscapter pachys]
MLCFIINLVTRCITRLMGGQRKFDKLYHRLVVPCRAVIGPFALGIFNIFAWIYSFKAVDGVLSAFTIDVLRVLGVFALLEVWVNYALCIYYAKQSSFTWWKEQMEIKRTNDFHDAGIAQPEKAEQQRRFMGNIAPNPELVKYCCTCKVDVPLRCSHCSICETCVMRSDHHCLVTGVCLGASNNGYFLISVFYLMCILTVSIYLQFLYLRENFRPELFPVLIMIKWLPVLMFQENDLTLDMVVRYFVFYMSATLYITSISYFAFNVYLFRRGYAMRELLSRKLASRYRGDKGSFWDRVRFMFGPNWFYHLLVPQFKRRYDAAYFDDIYKTFAPASHNYSCTI